MVVIGTDVVERYFVDHAGHKGIKGARSQYEAWRSIAIRAEWRNPQDVKAAYPKVSILKDGRVVFNIKGNAFRLVVAVDFEKAIVWIKWIGTHKDYDKIDVKGVQHDR